MEELVDADSRKVSYIASTVATAAMIHCQATTADHYRYYSYYHEDDGYYSCYCCCCY
jgi:hypothetical protein